MTKLSKNKAAIANFLDDIGNIDFVTEETVDEANVTNNQTATDNINSNVKFTLYKVDPKKCKPWRMANRFQSYITKETCQELITDIAAHGQHVPAIARKIPGKQVFELISGARRRFACEALGIELLVAVADLTDKDATLVMWAENKNRDDLSPYEEACDYKKWLDEGLFNTREELMAAINYEGKQSAFSKFLSLANLDIDIVHAFGHPNHMTAKWGYELNRLCNKNPEVRKKVLQKAADLSSSDTNVKPEAVYKALRQAAAIDAKEKVSAQNRTYKEFHNNSGQVIFTYNFKNKETYIKIPTKVGDEALKEICLIIEQQSD